MSETERPFLPMSWELGGDFMSGMADSIRERGAREVPGKEGVGVDEEKKRRSTISFLTKLSIIMLLVAVTATMGAFLTADVHWILQIEFIITAAVGYGVAGYALLSLYYQYQELRRLRR
jgi:hypothetical protein